MTNDRFRTEEHRVSGRRLKERLRELIEEGNVRRVVIRNAKGRTLLDMPLAAGVAGGVAGAVLAPLWLAIGGIVALAADVTVVIERVEKPGGSGPPPPRA